MIMTPIEIQSKSFKGSGMGYQKADVDTFMAQVVSAYEELYKENMSLKEKLDNMTESLNHYKEIEKSLQKALVLAETTAEETVVSAKKNAIVIEQEAVLKAQSIVADAKVDLERVRGQMDLLMKKYESYKAQYRALADAQIQLLDSEAFSFKAAAEDMEGLEKAAAEHLDVLQASPVNSGEKISEGESDAQEKTEQEDDFDETLSTDDSMIKDFSDIFDNKKKD